jgi:hypothetical protein
MTLLLVRKGKNTALRPGFASAARNSCVLRLSRRPLSGAQSSLKELTKGDLRAIGDAASRIEVEGERYAPQHMAMVGREAAPVRAGL